LGVFSYLDLCKTVVLSNLGIFVYSKTASGGWRIDLNPDFSKAACCNKAYNDKKFRAMMKRLRPAFYKLRESCIFTAPFPFRSPNKRLGRIFPKGKVMYFRILGKVDIGKMNGSINDSAQLFIAGFSIISS
jgi:hypothetical protein